MLNFKALYVLEDYLQDAVLGWESGITTTNPATQAFYKENKKFIAQIQLKNDTPHLLIASIDGSKTLLTSSIKNVTISCGYARIQTNNTTYHFWNAERATQIGKQVKQAQEAAEKAIVKQYIFSSED